MPAYIQAYRRTGKLIHGRDHLQCKIPYPRPIESPAWTALPDWAQYFPDVHHWKLIRYPRPHQPATLAIFENPHYVGK